MSEQHRAHRTFRTDEKYHAVLRILKGETAEQLAGEMGTSAVRLTKWHSRFVAGGREALAKTESESHRSGGFFDKYQSSILQWSTVAFLLILILATLTRLAATSEP